MLGGVACGIRQIKELPRRGAPTVTTYKHPQGYVRQLHDMAESDTTASPAALARERQHRRMAYVTFIQDSGNMCKVLDKGQPPGCTLL